MAETLLPTCVSIDHSALADGEGTFVSLGRLHVAVRVKELPHCKISIYTAVYEPENGVKGRERRIAHSSTPASHPVHFTMGAFQALGRVLLASYPCWHGEACKVSIRSE